MFSNAETMLLAAGSLIDGRPVWVTYCYTDPPHFPAPEKPGRGYGNRDALLAAEEPRAAIVGLNSDGSLAFVDAGVETDRS